MGRIARTCASAVRWSSKETWRYVAVTPASRFRYAHQALDPINATARAEIARAGRIIVCRLTLTLSGRGDGFGLRWTEVRHDAVECLGGLDSPLQCLARR